MEKHIQQAMNDDVIKEASLKFDIPFESIKRIGGFENFIYEFNKDGKDIILRFAHSVHRTFEYVLSELEFIDYLSKSGANVSTVIHNKDDEISFKVNTENEEYFTVSAFSKAPGTFIKREMLDDDFFEMFGKAVGKLHRLTKDFKPEHVRYQWYEEDYLEIAKRNLPSEVSFVLEEASKITEKIKSYETDMDSYGLIHTDLHFGNMYYDNEILTFFDFDDLAYKHFISDIAIIIFYQFAISKDSKEVIEEKANAFLKPFLKGYETENHLDKKWFMLLNDFFRLREAILIIVIYAEGEELMESPFGKLFTGKYLEHIKNSTDLVDIEKLLDGIY